MRNTVTVILVHDETESVLDTLFDGAESPNRVLNVSSVIHHFSTLAEGINDASNTMVIDLKFGGTALHVGSSLHGGADELPRPPLQSSVLRFCAPYASLLLSRSFYPFIYTTTIRIHSHGGVTVPMSCYRAKSEGAPSFSASSTALEVAEHANFTGKHAVVTGGNSGIGLETVRALYAAGAEGTLTLKTIDEPLWHRTQSRLQPFV